MEIIGWGRKYQPHRYRNELRDYGELHVIVLTQGSLRVESAEISRDIGPRSVLVLPPRATFTLSTPRQAYQGHFVLAPPQQSGLPPRVHLFRADAPLLRTIIDIETELSQTSQHQVVRALYLV
ncbi:MAG TPA: hypothetical protein VGJ84_20705, partial [Polyangiaceae bacterium]